jgi:2-polyprenyl-3-methyl-5-hydroxy-6-metoxy-1,4-benzoquinol methylase
MEPNAFVAEVYRRMSVRNEKAIEECFSENIDTKLKSPTVLDAIHSYKHVLPKKKDVRVLDIGFGDGWFIAALVKLGYQNIEGADFGASEKQGLLNWSPCVKKIHNIDLSIAEFLKNKADHYDFIHLSHVIEHIPKHSLLYIMDALYLALKSNGMLLMRTPNMEGPCANSCLFVTLGHEYGFTGSNLCSLMDLTGFDNVQLHKLKIFNPSIKQRLGSVARAPFIAFNALKHRFFGVNHGGFFGIELMVSGNKGDCPPFFNERYK